MGKVCGRLRGDAFVVAQEAGFDNLCEIIGGRLHGIEALISHMRETVFPSTEYASKRLFCQHCCSDGPSSRQNGESKEQYVSQRRRCGTPLTQMDSVIHLSERHQSDMLLDLSGMTRKRRVEEQASTNSDSDFDKVADALVIQQPRVPLRESSEAPEEKGKDTHRLQEGGKHSDNGKPGTSVRCTNFNFVDDCDHSDDTDDRADTYRANSDLSHLGGNGREEVLGRPVDEEKVRFLHTLFRATSPLSWQPSRYHCSSCRQAGQQY